MLKIVTRSGIMLGVLSVVVGCAAAPQSQTLADGSNAIQIECDGSASGLTRCLERAGRSCGAQGYSLVDKNGVRIAKGSVADASMETIVKAYEMDKNSILIVCD